MADPRLVSVLPLSGVGFRYGFSSRLDADDAAALGHVDVGATPNGIVFGANSPKPGRFFKIKADGHSTSGFIDITKRGSARAAGWKQSKKAKFRTSAGGCFTKAVYVKLDAGEVRVNYAWNMKTDVYTAIGAARATLGILDVAGNPKELIWGSQSPRPVRVKNTTLGISTLADPSANLPDGWTGAGEE